MVKRTFLALAVLLVVQVLFSTPAAAQSQSSIPTSCIATQTWWSTDGPVPFGWFFYSAYPGTFAYLIAAMTSCPPPCPWCAKRAQAGHPISLTTGDTFIDETDIQIPGLGGGLSLGRSWHSIWPSRLSSFQTGMFGPNWRSTYEDRIVSSADNYVTLLRSDGTFWTFGAGPTVRAWASIGPGGTGISLSTDTITQPNFTLTLANGEQRNFDGKTGHLVAILDPNGNTTQLTYDGSGRLVTVTDPASRTMTFTYDTTFTNQVASVSTSVGISLSYTYDTQGRLTKVTKPDSTTVSFTYDSSSRITSVTDSNGKVLESHTYDSSNRGLTSSQANGVQAVTVSYQ